jgi:hypothetical protein
MMHFDAVGMSFMQDGTPKVLQKPMQNYIQSKVGESWIAAEFAKRLGDKRILSVVRRWAACYGRQGANYLSRACTLGS